MKRRIQGAFLIAVLLGGHPLQPVRAAAVFTARVQVGPIAPDRIQAVRADVLTIKGVAVRAVVVGRCMYVDVSAKSPHQLAAALSRLAQVAGQAGLKIRILASVGQELRAVAARPLRVDRPQRADGGPAAALPARPDQHRPVGANLTNAADPLPIPSGVILDALGARAPPA